MKLKKDQTMMRIDKDLLYELDQYKRKKLNKKWESYAEVIRRLLDAGGKERLIREREELLLS